MWLALLVIVAGVARLAPGMDERRFIAAMISCLSVSLTLVVADLLTGKPVAGGFNTGNTIAPLLVVAAPLALWLAATAKTRHERLGWYAAAASLSATTVLAASAAGVYGLFVALVFVAIATPSVLGVVTPARIGMLRVALLSLTAGGVVLAAIGWLSPQRLPSGIRDYIRQEVFGVTLLTRLEMWRSALRVLAERPLLGFGPDSFHLAAQPYLTERLFDLEPVTGALSVPPDPHSLPLLLGVSFGVVGLTAFAVVAVVWARSVVVRRTDEPAERRALRLCAAAGVAGFFSALLFVPGAIIMGGLPAACAGLAVGREGTARVSRRAPWSIGLALFGAVALVVLAALLVVGLVHLDRGIEADDAHAAVRAYNSAARTLPTYALARFASLHAEGIQLGAGDASLADWGARVDADSDMQADATYAALLVRDALDQAFRWGRRDLTWEQSLLREAAERFPASPDVRLEQAHLAILSSDTSAAVQILSGLAEIARAETRVDLYRYYVAVAEEDSATVNALRASLADEYGNLALLAPLR